MSDSAALLDAVSSTSTAAPAPLDANATVLTHEEKSAVTLKLEIARSKKDVADAAFKSGDLKSALRSYHEVRMPGCRGVGLSIRLGTHVPPRDR